MTNINLQASEYLYTCTHGLEERSLCALEQRALFGEESANLIKSTRNIDPSRSPFIKGKLAVLFSGDSVQDIAERVNQIELGNQTFKVQYLKINDLSNEQKIEFAEQRVIEKEIGWNIIGKAKMKNPDVLFGIAPFQGRWYFGVYQESESVWLHHVKKPHEYSTAISTRLARAVVNIAVPDPAGVRVIDPCCGIGTVLVEALSMGIEIVGSDRNPLAVKGARENIAFFHYDTTVEVKDIAKQDGHYDVAIIDMPYNLYSPATPAEQFAIIQHARRIADRVLILTLEDMDEMIATAGFTIVDRCEAHKGLKALFSRQVIVCE
ncbi:TRM11 family SAM-dependent methyltransferase [Gracilibacillus salinarum]|uniref:Methyltransferase domain-containing protein n=1 Tax=Gracilibacillus salinarum TaxID=2932255 RepID=A0ABY4GHV2_9BACI|nr:methyltransferase domain-containing protein [Gracilibacillus salinarum]UOQ83751.1 methyltransferase domain-containing protein [Gracilibacillus salinarum]